MPVRLPVPVSATCGSQVKQFKSYGTAAKFLSDTVSEAAGLDGKAIKRSIEQGQELFGWKFQHANAVQAQPLAKHTVQPLAQPLAEPLAQPSVQQTVEPFDPITFVFGPEAGELFKGKSVRVTPDKKVSVHDVIRVVSGVQKAWYTLSTITDKHPEVAQKLADFQFPGQGSRPTPVTDVEGMLYIINLLPGKHAAAFRAGGAKLLVRFLGGDETLVDEVQAIANHHASGASQGTVGQLFHERAQEQVQEQVQALPPVPNKYALLSPSMRGRDMHDFLGKEVCYLLLFTQDDGQYMKFGYTSDVHKRMTEHMRELPSCQLYFMLDTPHAKRVEDEFRKKMLYKGHLTDLVIKGKRQTEILCGICPEQAEQILVQLHEASYTSDDDSMRLKLAKLELRKVEIEANAQVRKAELETQAEVRLKELEYRAQVQLRILALLETQPEMLQHMSAVAALLGPTA